jgi:hypothetical protein
MRIGIVLCRFQVCLRAIEIDQDRGRIYLVDPHDGLS